MQRRQFFAFLAGGVGVAATGGVAPDNPPAKDQEKPVEEIKMKVVTDNPYGSSVWLDGLQLQPGKILTIENKSGRWVSVFPPK